MNNDRLNSTPPHAAVSAAYAQVSAVQHLPKEQQVAGAAILLRIMAEELRLDLPDLLHKAARLADSSDTYFNRSMDALREYIRKELA